MGRITLVMTRTHTSPSPQPLDHRTRVGMARREKTRTSLLKGALLVFSQHGVDAKVIDLIIRQAGVSRGTFYNYFRTNEELFVAVAKEVSDEIIRIVEPFVQQRKDPAARVACGVSMVIRLAQAYPVMGQFVVRGGPPALCAGSLASEVVPRDIRDGMASGRFHVADERLAFDLILGPVIMGFHTILTEVVPPNYAQALAQSVLLSLGVSKSLATKYAIQELGAIQLSEDSIFFAGTSPTPNSQAPRTL